MIRDGQAVLHPQHGIGRVIHGGADPGDGPGVVPDSFVKIYFERTKLTIFVREEDLKQTVRSIVGADEARRVLKHITDGNAEITAHWKARAEQNEIAIERGSPLELANVYMGLSRIRHEGGSLRAVDRKHLEVSGQTLSEELSAALGKPRRHIQRMMEEPYSVDDRGDSKNY